VVKRALTIVSCGLALIAPWAGCKKSSPDKKESGSIEHKASIPIIPRGKVVAIRSKGEITLLEIEARMPLSQAVTFYRRQLARENWAELRIWKAEPGLWGLSAQRGMFAITGRIRRIKQGVISIGFERRIRKRTAPVTPPVPKDVPILKDQITWRGPFFEAPGGRAEIRGTSTIAAPALVKTLVAALGRKGWTVKRLAGNTRQATKTITRTLTPETRKAEARKLQQRGWTVKLLTDGKTIDAQRQVVYHVEGGGKTTRVRMILAYSELKSAHAKTSEPPRPAGIADAGTARPRSPQSANVVPLPKDLILWPSKDPVLGVKRSDAMLHFSLERKCDSPGVLLKEIRGILLKRGYRTLSGGHLSGVETRSGPTRSATLLKGKRAVVVIVNQESETCTVQLTLLRN
jgi:hypothetical protein